MAGSAHHQRFDRLQRGAADRAMYVAKEGGRNQVRATSTGGAALEAVKALVMR